MSDTTIQVKFLKNLTLARVMHLKGSKMEVSTELFERMRRRGAVEAVEIAAVGSSNIVMEAVKAEAEQKQQEAADGTRGNTASMPRGRRSGRTRRPPDG